MYHDNRKNLIEFQSHRSAVKVTGLDFQILNHSDIKSLYSGSVVVDLNLSVDQSIRYTYYRNQIFQYLLFTLNMNVGLSVTFMPHLNKCVFDL